ncbi:MAG: sigma-54-dependent Fis family transcriptional regulator [Desulfobacteraceae bacterium]|nr:MAG: sigma-54-dependent Fis family transcriptional regulator [Desulfobacteraceae bacterium]
MANILIIDDDPIIQELLFAHVEQSKNIPFVAGSLHQAVKLADTTEFDLIFLDVRLPDGNGLEALPRFKQLPSQPEVVIITAVGDAEGAEMAIKSGAWSYIQKPTTHHEISLQINRALQYREKRPRTQAIALKRNQIIGRSPQLNGALNIIAQAAQTEANVLITGETGTGKELFAQTLHKNSLRADKSFVVVDCTALPETLIESVLFGHVKGAFTSAEKERTGLIARADKGTLFLDEIGELPLETQKTFLRVLQERCFTPIGSSKEIKCDFRLISATNRDLDKMVEKGEFRNDLLFRIKTFHVDLPPLRNRQHDVREITLHFIAMICERHRLQVKGFTSEFMDLLEIYKWPGNIRELYHTLEKAILTESGNPTLFPMHLPASLRIYQAKADMEIKRGKAKEKIGNANQETFLAMEQPSGFTMTDHEILPLKTYRQKIIEEGESRYLSHLLQTVDHDIQKAVKMSGVGQARLYGLLKKYRLKTKSD